MSTSRVHIQRQRRRTARDQLKANEYYDNNGRIEKQQKNGSYIKRDPKRKMNASICSATRRASAKIVHYCEGPQRE